MQTSITKQEYPLLASPAASTPFTSIRQTGRYAQPPLDLDLAANHLIDDAAFWAAIIGAGVGSVHSIPGVGTAITVRVVLPEIVYLAKLQVSTVLQLAVVYDRTLDREQVVHVVLACLVYSYAFEQLKDVVKRVAVGLTRQAVEAAIARTTMRFGAAVAEGISIDFCRRGLARMVPLVAVPVNAVLNYAGLQILGHTAKRYFCPSYRRCIRCGGIEPRCSLYCSHCGARMRSPQDPPDLSPVPA